MAIALTQVGRRTVFGDRRVIIFDITFDSSFADEGESLTAADCGLSRIDHVSCETAYNMTADLGYLLAYNHATSKLVAFNGGTTDAPFEEAGTDDLSAYSCRIMVVGA